MKSWPNGSSMFIRLEERSKGLEDEEGTNEKKKLELVRGKSQLKPLNFHKQLITQNSNKNG